jgi:hypothetical protein
VGAQGSVEVDFGAHPGAVEKEADVAATGVISTSLVEAWLVPKATADHTVDEHVAEGDQLHVQGRFKSNDIITIRVAPRQVPLDALSPGEEPITQSRGVNTGAERARTYGKWNIGWVWN